jgi:hypothetical protein
MSSLSTLLSCEVEFRGANVDAVEGPHFIFELILAFQGVLTPVVARMPPSQVQYWQPEATSTPRAIREANQPAALRMAE